MRITICTLYISLIVTFFCCNIAAEPYPWLVDSNDSNSIENRIPSPERFHRVETETGSFTHWLRNLPLKDKDAKVFLFNGQKKANQNAHHAVVNIDTGDKDLQQCADAIIRLRSEYLFSQNRMDDISFKFTSGDNASFRKWINGYRPVVNGNNVTWKNINRIDSSYASFRNYLDIVFIYCGTYSLSKELISVDETTETLPGDVFIQGGFPGHAILVIDVVLDNKGNRLCLLGQGFTPAQDIHILKNPNNPELSPWYDTNFGNRLKTPEWTFKKTDLKRFNEH